MEWRGIYFSHTTGDSFRMNLPFYNDKISYFTLSSKEQNLRRKFPSHKKGKERKKEECKWFGPPQENNSIRPKTNCVGTFLAHAKGRSRVKFNNLEPNGFFCRTEWHSKACGHQQDNLIYIPGPHNFEAAYIIGILQQRSGSDWTSFKLAFMHNARSWRMSKRSQCTKIRALVGVESTVLHVKFALSRDSRFDLVQWCKNVGENKKILRPNCLGCMSWGLQVCQWLA